MTVDPITVIEQLWSFPFMVNAYRAGTVVAVLCGVLGWFMVLRRESFTGHALSTVAFPGGAGAILVGLSATVGYFAFCVAAALVLAALPASRGAGRAALGEESAVTGTVQSFALACGFLFVALYGGFLDGLDALLFGSFLGVTDTQVVVLAVVAIVALLGLAVIARPLWFASVDPVVARARRIPVTAVTTVFLVLLGCAAAEASQITGTLLVFALLVMPPAAAHVLTAVPAHGLALSVLIGLVVTWAGLAAAFYTPFPIGFFVTTFAFAVYLLAHGVRALRERRAVPRSATPAVAG